MFWLKGCPRCHGDLHRIHDVGATYVSCLQCGRILTEEQENALPQELSVRAPGRPALRLVSSDVALRRSRAARPIRTDLAA